MIRRVFGSAALLLALLLPLQVSAYGSSQDVTIGVGDTVLTINGQTSPGAFVTIRDGGNTIGSVTAAADGTFSVSFGAQPAGRHDLLISARDTDGVLSDDAAVSAELTEHYETTVAVFLPPTITLRPTTVANGSQLVLNGQTAPNATIVISIDNSEFRRTTAGADGRWLVQLPLASLSVGVHSLVAVAQDSSGTSHPTSRRFFEILPPPAPSRPPGYRPLPPLGGGSLVVGDKLTLATDRDQVVVWPAGDYRGTLTIVGGVLPRYYTIDWGDGHSDIGVTDQNQLPLQHKYARPGSYVISIAVAEPGGQRAVTTVRVRYPGPPLDPGFLLAAVPPLLLISLLGLIILHYRGRRAADQVPDPFIDTKD